MLLYVNKDDFFKCCFMSTETISSNVALRPLRRFLQMLFSIHRDDFFKYCFTSTETIKTIRDGHRDFHTAPELGARCMQVDESVLSTLSVPQRARRLSRMRISAYQQRGTTLAASHPTGMPQRRARLAAGQTKGDISPVASSTFLLAGNFPTVLKVIYSQG